MSLGFGFDVSLRPDLLAARGRNSGLGIADPWMVPSSSIGRLSAPPEGPAPASARADSAARCAVETNKHNKHNKHNNITNITT